MYVVGLFLAVCKIMAPQCDIVLQRPLLLLWWRVGGHPTHQPTFTCKEDATFFKSVYP
jgi:hypothetical protein